MKQINGDNPGHFINRLLYFFQCLKDHRKGDSKSFEIYQPTLSILNLDTFGKTPSRLLCDAFWNSIDYENIRLKLNSKINFFDVGCGSGLYGTFLRKISGKFFSSYTGLDIYKNNSYPKEFRHIISKAENVYSFIDKQTNFIISQSALEHIEKDVFAIEEITKKLVQNEKPFIQIHMVPASKSLWLYLWHGYRQYSKKNLSDQLNKLKNKFDINSIIIPIGGNKSFWTHLLNITIPVYFKKLIKDKNFKWYNQNHVEKKIIESVHKELNCMNENPVFWAFVVASKNINIKKDVLKKDKVINKYE